MTNVDLVQRSPEWFDARCGSLGASVIGKALTRYKDPKKSAERPKEALDLMYEIAAERLTGIPARQVNALRWGNEHEAEARATYAFLTNAPLVRVGLIPHPTILNAHASPDSLIGDEGGLELKCPTSATHLKTLLTEEVPEDHLPQCYWGMACSGRAWWDFCSYDPRFTDDRQHIFVKRVERDEAIIATMEAEARAFLAELEDKLMRLDRRYPVESV
jgi:YqaJ-like viral recombinase domain